MTTVRPYGHSPDITLHWVTRTRLLDVVLKREINGLPFQVILETLIYKMTANINKDLLFGNKKCSATENNKGLIKGGRKARGETESKSRE